MKIPSLVYINKSNKISGAFGVSGNYDLYGHGEDSEPIVFSEDMAFINHPSFLGGAGRRGSILELGNVTIESGVKVVGLTDNLKNTPFYLKVSGTLTINGHLHMDGMGAGTINTSTPGVSTYTRDGLLTYTAPNALRNTALISTQLKDNQSCLDTSWSSLLTYGMSETFFTMKTGLTGAGGCGINYSLATMYGLESTGLISGGGNIMSLSRPTAGNSITAGGGGGLLCIYFGTLDNKGPTHTDNTGTYYSNIHANGGVSIINNSTPIYGGGMMVIAARNLVIGPGGKITCDAQEDGNGLMSLANRSPNTEPMLFNNGNPIPYTNQFSGGAGFCTLYKR